MAHFVANSLHMGHICQMGEATHLMNTLSLCNMTQWRKRSLIAAKSINHCQQVTFKMDSPQPQLRCKTKSFEAKAQAGESMPDPDPVPDLVMTRGHIHNVTGKTVTFIGSKDFNGHVGGEPCPPTIDDGDSGGKFNHVANKGDVEESCGVVVYRGQNKNGESCDWMFAWYTPVDLSKRKVYTEINESGYFDITDDSKSKAIQDKLMKSGPTKTCEWKGCKSSISSTSGVKNAQVNAKMELK